MYFYIFNETNYMSSSSPIVSDKHREITEDEFNQETRKNEIAVLNERRAQLLEKQKTETDELNILLIERELKEINEYFASKE